MSIDDVATIHRHVQSDLALSGSTVDAFQVCPHLESEGCACRKPNAGLVLDWLDEHPDVEARLSVVVGDSSSDLELARNVAAKTGGCAAVHITGAASEGEADACFASLWDLAAEVAAATGLELR